MAIAACRGSDGADAVDLYPDPDRPLLVAAIEAAGADAAPVSWDDEDVDWRRFDLTVIRSTWDSVDRPQEYLGWARAASRSTTVMNPVAAIEWNIDKGYLRALRSRGIAVAPTQWVVEEGPWEPPEYEFVVKPATSGGGRETARYHPDDAHAAAAHVRRLLGAGRTVMVQPYIGSVDTDGEAKLVFIEGEFSHAVRVGPLLVAGEGVPERPWEKAVPMDSMTPTSAQLDAAYDVLAAVSAELRLTLLYARVDLVTAQTGQPLLAEVELIDPSLLLRLDPPSAGRLAAAIVANARRGMRHT